MNGTPWTSPVRAARGRVVLFLCAMLLASAAPIFGSGVSEEGEPAGEATAAAARRVVTDALGREISVSTDPRRIVTAGRAVLMIADVIYAFEEAPERLVAIGRINQGRGNFLRSIDPDYDEKAVLERNVGPEQIAALSPDLVILKTFMRETLGTGLERLDIPVLYVELETPEQYQRDILTLGTVFDEEARAASLAEWYRRRAAEIEERTTPLAADRRPRTLLVYYRSTDGDVSFQVPPAGWIQTQLVESAGGFPVWPESVSGGGWITVGFEQIAAWNPDEIVLVAYDGSGPDVRDRLTRQPRWQALAAVQAGRFHAFPVDYYSWDQPDTRWILGLQWLATRLQPDLFEGIDMTERAREFFRVVYGMNEAAYAETIAPILTGDID
ncbi:MAG: ABC transporter substrate-binding protein [Spirochaetales bacterium]|nr:ABC transporter substrate-binding protein [Spirochaetales bacterium]